MKGETFMKKPQYHFFLCNSYRANGEPQGVCNKKERSICCNTCKASCRPRHRRHRLDHQLPERLRKGADPRGLSQ